MVGIVVVALALAVAGTMVVVLRRRARGRRPAPLDEPALDPVDIADLAARFERIDAERAAHHGVLLEIHLRPLVDRRVPVRCVEAVPELHTTRVRFADGTAVVVRGETAGDAGVLASVVRQHRVLPADYSTDAAGTHLVFDWSGGRRQMSLLVTGLDQPD
jgi:hypothetical protein